jgi:hypothetical protein
VVVVMEAVVVAEVVVMMMMEAVTTEMATPEGRDRRRGRSQERHGECGQRSRCEQDFSGLVGHDVSPLGPEVERLLISCIS